MRRDLEEGIGILTITGPSGIGKTRLARQLAHEVSPLFNDEGGAWLCNASPCLESAEVEAAVARTLGIPQKHGSDLAGAIAEHGKLLLILDNLDSVAAKVAELLGGWLDRCPLLQIVTTSIVPIPIDDAVRLELGPLEAKDAIALYLERAHRAWAGKVFTDSDRPAVEELVGRLDRIPLAIELAAARVRVLPPRALLTRIDDRFELLNSGKEHRHGSLLEALTLTWELLPEKEQRLLARASVFAGGFTHAAAAAVLFEEGSGELEMLDLLDGLRSKSLLQLEDTDEPRFTLFESVRDFAAKELRRSGLEDQVLRRHVSHFLERGEEAVARAATPDSMEALGWLKAERENLVAVFQRYREREPRIAARAGIVLFPLIKHEGFMPTGVELLTQALSAARKSDDPSLLLRLIDHHLAAIIPQGKANEGRAQLEEGLRLARDLGNREEEGNLLLRLGWIHLRQGELEQMVSPLEQAIAIAKAEDLPLLEASALMILGEGAHSRAAIAEAERATTEGLDILRRNDYPVEERDNLVGLALVRATQGRFNEARTALHSALSRSKETGDKDMEASVLLNLGGVELMAGMLAEAERYSIDALAIQRQLGNRRREGLALANLGNISLERGELELAERRLGECIAIFKECGDRRFHAAVLSFLSVAEARVGRPSAARESLEEARAYFQEVDDRVGLATTDILEGCLELARARHLPLDRAAAAQGLIHCARERLERTRALGEELQGSMFEALRLLENDLLLMDRAGDEAAGQLPSQASILVGPEAAWFEVAGQGRVTLRRRMALRRLLNALVSKRLQSPGTPLGPQTLFEIGWPNVQIHPEPAMRRVYLAIWTLRDMGLSDAILNQTDGYLFDPAVPLSREAG